MTASPQLTTVKPEKIIFLPETLVQILYSACFLRAFEMVALKFKQKMKIAEPLLSVNAPKTLCLHSRDKAL